MAWHMRHEEEPIIRAVIDILIEFFSNAARRTPS
jgi:hypothetical protein